MSKHDRVIVYFGIVILLILKKIEFSTATTYLGLFLTGYLFRAGLEAILDIVYGHKEKQNEKDE